ncbi:MAG TPA: S-layer homology domain-containing protein, partial [Candidatus Peribacteraceae bacterium]|nr:S-layer homology domain-containing protein [Candidatus Peribacteraceae bacterium]
MKIRSSTAALAFVFLWISVSLLKHGETQASVLPSFRDVAQNTPEGEAVGWLAELDIISGFPDGSFRGTEPVDRSQAAKILLRASKKPMTVYFNRGRFADVDDGTWYVPYALTMSELGIVEGYADRTFKPKGT